VCRSTNFRIIFMVDEYSVDEFTGRRIFVPPIKHPYKKYMDTKYGVTKIAKKTLFTYSRKSFRCLFKKCSQSVESPSSNPNDKHFDLRKHRGGQGLRKIWKVIRHERSPKVQGQVLDQTSHLVKIGVRSPAKENIATRVAR
jgi:hypothetical protein